MKSDTILEIFRLFNMKNKTEQQIMALIKESGYHNKDLCKLAITLLKSEENIMTVIYHTCYDEGVCQAGIKTLIKKNWTDNQILAFLKRVRDNSDSIITKLCIPYFKLNDKKEYELINLLRKVDYTFYFLQPCLKALDIDKKNDKQLIALMEITNYHESFCYACITHLKTEENILSLMERSGTPDYVVVAGAELIKWKKKSENEILAIIEKSHDKFSFYDNGILYLKNVENILKVLKLINYSYSTLGTVLPVLKLDQKSESELWRIMKLSDYAYSVCTECLAFINLSEKDDDELKGLMLETEMNPLICENIVPNLKSEEPILFAIKNTKFNDDVCAAALPLLFKGDEATIFSLLENTHYCDAVCEVGIPLLTNEDSIFRAMGNAHFASKALDAGLVAIKKLKPAEVK